MAFSATARRSRYVTLCQRLLVLGFVGAALVPAASVVNLDVVHEPSTAASLSGANSTARAWAELGQSIADLSENPLR